MVQATFDLPEDTLAALEALAAERGASASALLQVALTEWLSRKRLSPDEWLATWRALQAEAAEDLPPGTTPEDIEAEIDAATEEVWAERRAAGRR